MQVAILAKYSCISLTDTMKYSSPVKEMQKNFTLGVVWLSSECDYMLLLSYVAQLHVYETST